ncbi:MAG: ECF transporter S component [Actinomycetota bacterium]|nr:ECF transporter S component [Actinomycetota bacterium]
MLSRGDGGSVDRGRGSSDFRPPRLPGGVLFTCAAVAFVSAVWAALDPARGAFAVLLAALAVLAAGAAWLERDPGSVKDLTLVATLGGLAAAGRILFAPVPNVQPVTVIVAAAGVALGPRRGFAVGALAALASNFFLGQGPHTPWQMLSWGACGVAAGLARRFLTRRVPFALFCFALGFAYGVPMDLWHWYGFLRDWPVTYVLGAGFAFNVAHACGNLVLALVAGPELRRVLDRYDRRLRTEIAWA